MKAWIYAFAATLLAAGPAAAESDEPVAYDVWFDARLQPHPENPQVTVFVAGDSLTVHVDPTRLFPDRSTPMLGLGFAAGSAPPEVNGLYVVGPGDGFETPVSIQPGLCGMAVAAAATRTAKDNLDKAVAAAAAATPEAKQLAEQAVADAVAAVAKAKAAEDHVVVTPVPGGACVRASDWHLNDSDASPYICHGDRTLGKLIQESTEWSLVQRSPVSNPQDPRHPTYEHVCLKEWSLAAGPAVTGIAGEVVHGASAPEALVFAKDTSAANLTIKGNTREIRLTVDGAVARRTLPIKARTRDSHSLVRIQAEILATNRLRSVSFAVAVSPVRRAFFTDGPGWDCKALCALTPMALLRLSGEDKTVVQFGGGLALNLVRAFQVNAGFLFGTADVNTAWRLEHSWFVGIAIDPVLLSEVFSATRKD